MATKLLYEIRNELTVMCTLKGDSFTRMDYMRQLREGFIQISE